MQTQFRGLTDSPVNIKAEAGEKVITGYAAVYNSMSEDLGGFTEIIRPGAFDRSLREIADGTRTVLARIQHEGGLSVVGSTDNATLDLWSDSIGLGYKIRKLPNTSAARDAVELIGGGYINKSSFAFEVGPAGRRWDSKAAPPVLELLDVDLVDVAPVDIPAYSAATVEMRQKIKAEIPAPEPEAEPVATKKIELRIFDAIVPTWLSRYMTDTTSGGEVAEALAAVPDAERIDVYINSPGGDTMEGMAIYETLRAHPAPVNIHIQGMAASAAALIAMAGDTIQISQGGFLMIHNSWMAAQGNAREMRENAMLLDKVDLGMAKILAMRSGAELKAVQKMMDAETWMTAEEAVGKGFANNIIGKAALTVTDGERCREMGFRNIPAALGGSARVMRRAVTNEERRAITAAQIQKLK